MAIVTSVVLDDAPQADGRRHIRERPLFVQLVGINDALLPLTFFGFYIWHADGNRVRGRN